MDGSTCDDLGVEFYYSDVLAQTTNLPRPKVEMATFKTLTMDHGDKGFDVGLAESPDRSAVFIAGTVVVTRH